jgi:hypothetical protein
MKRNIYIYIYVFVFFIILFLFYNYLKKNKFIENFKNESTYEGIFPFDITPLYQIEKPLRCSNTFYFPEPNNGQIFNIPGHKLKYCRGAINSKIRYYQIEKNDIGYDLKCYNENQEFAIPGYLLKYHGQNTIDDVKIQPINEVIIENFDNTTRFPFEIRNLYADTNIQIDDCENMFLFPKPEEYQKFKIPGFVLEFCSSARNSRVPFYNITNGEVDGELCYIKDDEFGIPGYILTYTAEQRPYGTFKMKMNWKGKEFYDGENNWVFYKNKKCNMNKLQDKGNVYITDDTGEKVCCTEKKEGAVCFGRFNKQINTLDDDDTVLKIKLSKKVNEKPSSIKLESKQLFAGCIAFIDVKHMPVGLSVWGTIRLTEDSDNPNASEIDLVQSFNSVIGTYNEKYERENENIYRKEQSKNITSLFTRIETRCEQDIPNLLPYPLSGEDSRESNKCNNDLYGCKVFGPEQSAGSTFNNENGGLFICFPDIGGNIMMWFFKYGSLDYNKFSNYNSDSDFSITDLGQPHTTYNRCRGSFGSMKLSIDINVCGTRGGGYFPSLKKEQPVDFEWLPPIASTDEARQKACDMYIESIKERSTDDEVQPPIFDKAYWEIRNIKIFGNIYSRYDSVNSPFNG